MHSHSVIIVYYKILNAVIFLPKNHTKIYDMSIVFYPEIIS